MNPAPVPRETIAELRAQVAAAQTCRGPVLPYGIDRIDDRLADRGLDRHALHKIAPASPALSDDAAATLFTAGIAARLARTSGQVLWALTRFDLYAPGLEQAGLAPACVIYAEAREDAEVLALVEDGLRHGALAAVVGEVRKVSMTATRRLQLAAAEGRTPALLFRRWRRQGACPLTDPSSATTRWRIGTARSAPLPHPGVGRGRWAVELVRQRNGDPFSVQLEACDDTGRLALPAAAADRAVAPGRAAARAA